jgi:Putative zinc dependent peptidase (DUF5700)
MRPGLVLVLLTLTLGCATAPPPALDVRMVPDEAYAVLTILDKRHRGESITEADWGLVFGSEGYVRLKAREQAMQRKFEDGTFREFVRSEALLARREELASTVESWLAADISRSRDLALAYLPKGARMRAKVYPVVKPATNSFVFDLEGDPAIFMYVEAQPREVFEATIAHELHHVGYAANCPPSSDPWISGFGEGIAALAAAGGPQGVPQLRPEVAAEWAKQMGQYDANFHAVAGFLTAVAKGELTGDAERQRGFEFFGMVGPWYTVGWKMAVVIESVLGRDALIEASCGGRELLRAYNRAVPRWRERTGEELPMWPRVLTE